MVKIPAEVRETIDRYIEALRRNHLPVEQAVLFGSYARGRHKEWSDIDIALVSDQPNKPLICEV